MSADHIGKTTIIEMHANCGPLFINYNGALHEIAPMPISNPGGVPPLIVRQISNSNSIASSNSPFDHGAVTTEEPMNHRFPDGVEDYQQGDIVQPWDNMFDQNYYVPENGMRSTVEEEEKDEVEVFNVVETTLFLINKLKSLMSPLLNQIKSTDLNLDSAHRLLTDVLEKTFEASFRHLPSIAVVQLISGLGSAEAKKKLEGSEEMLQNSIECIRRLVPGIEVDVSTIKREEEVERKPDIQHNAEQLSAPADSAPVPSIGAGAAPYAAHPSPFDRMSPYFGTGQLLPFFQQGDIPSTVEAPNLAPRARLPTIMEMRNLKPNGFGSSEFAQLNPNQVVGKAIYEMRALQQDPSHLKRQTNLLKTIHNVWSFLEHSRPSELTRNVELLENTINLMEDNRTTIEDSDVLVQLLKWIGFRINRLLSSERRTVKRNNEDPAVDVSVEMKKVKRAKMGDQMVEAGKK